MVILKAPQQWVDYLSAGGANVSGAEVILVGSGQGPPVTISKSLLITVATEDLQFFLHTTDCHCQAPVTIMIPSATNSTLLQVSQVLSQGKADIVSGHQTCKRRLKEVEEVESVLELLTFGVNVAKIISGGGENGSPKQEEDQDLSTAGPSYNDQGDQQQEDDEDLAQQQVLTNHAQHDIVTHGEGATREIGRDLAHQVPSISGGGGENASPKQEEVDDDIDYIDWVHKGTKEELKEELNYEIYDDWNLSTAEPSYNDQGDQQEEDSEMSQVMGVDLAQQQVLTNHVQLADIATQGDGATRETSRDLAQQVPSIGRGSGSGGKSQVADNPVKKEYESLSSDELMDVDVLVQSDDEDVEQTADMDRLDGESKAEHCEVVKDTVGPSQHMAKKTGIVEHSVVRGRRQESVEMGDSENRVHKRLVVKGSHVNRKKKTSWNEKDKVEIDGNTILRNSVGLFPCSFCDKQFKFPSALKKHIVTHTGQKDYQCNICSKSFGRLDTLKRHLEQCNEHYVQLKPVLDESVVDVGMIKSKFSGREQHEMVPKKLKIEREDPPNLLECNFCQKTYTIAASMASHMVKHSPSRENVFCPLCRFSTDQTRLVKHIRSHHSMEKVYSCGTCRMKFCNFESKSAHEKKHDNPDLCQCPGCGSKRFYNIQLGRGCTNCSKK